MGQPDPARGIAERSARRNVQAQAGMQSPLSAGFPHLPLCDGRGSVLAHSRIAALFPCPSPSIPSPSTSPSTMAKPSSQPGLPSTLMGLHPTGSTDVLASLSPTQRNAQTPRLTSQPVQWSGLSLPFQAPEVLIWVPPVTLPEHAEKDGALPGKK